MGKPNQEINKTRSKIRKLGIDSPNKDAFYTHDRDSNSVVRNEKKGNDHNIYKDGKLYKNHKEK